MLPSLVVRRRRLLVFAGALALGVSAVLVWSQAPASDEWKVPASKTRIANPIAPTAEAIAAGKPLFEKECLPCHGPTGVGNGPAAKDLEKPPGNLSRPVMWDQTDGALFFKVTVGRRPMPSFREKFSDDERWHIIDYVRTLTTPDAKPTVAGPAPARQLLSGVLPGYATLETALVEGQLEPARQAAANLAKPIAALAAFDVSGLPEAGRAPWAELAKNLAKDQGAFADAADLDGARVAFGDLSFDLQIAVRTFGHAEAQPVRLYQSQQVADHKGALWLVSKDTPGDPYAGKDKTGRVVANISGN